MSYTPIDGPGYEISGEEQGPGRTAASQLLRQRSPLPHNPEHSHSPWDAGDLLEPEGEQESEPNWIGQPPYVERENDGYEEWLKFEPWQGLRP